MPSPTTSNPEMLRALDPELPFLASEAAIDLDNLLNHRSNDVVAVHHLADRLKKTLAPAEGTVRARFLDHGTLTVLGEAINQVPGETELQEVDELISRASKIADELSSSDSSIDRARLEWARSFCVALSRCAAEYRKSIHEVRQHHPFRR